MKIKIGGLMHAIKVTESYHFEQNGFDYFEAVSKEKTFGVWVRCVIVTKPMKEHSHPDVEQIYYIRSGRGVMRIDGQEQEVEKDTVIYIPPGAKHNIIPIESEEELSYLFFSHDHAFSSRDKK